jgi:hypothetical protein
LERGPFEKQSREIKEIKAAMAGALKDHRGYV